MGMSSIYIYKVWTGRLRNARYNTSYRTIESKWVLIIEDEIKYEFMKIVYDV